MEKKYYGYLESNDCIKSFSSFFFPLLFPLKIILKLLIIFPKQHKCTMQCNQFHFQLYFSLVTITTAIVVILYFDIFYHNTFCQI